MGFALYTFENKRDPCVIICWVSSSSNIYFLIAQYILQSQETGTQLLTNTSSSIPSLFFFPQHMSPEDAPNFLQLLSSQ